MRGVLLESAQTDLADLRGYIIKNFTTATWRASYAKLKTSIRDLAMFPHLGGVPDELEPLKLTQYRQVLSGMSGSFARSGTRWCTSI